MKGTGRSVLIVLSVVAGLMGPQAGVAGQPRTGNFEIVERSGRWQLLRDGEPFYVKGAVGWHSYELLRQCGGNAVRTGARKANLGRAHQAGLVALANLPVRGQRNGMDWGDEQAVAEQKARVLQTVRELKDHPAVMFWAVGNELDWIPPGIAHHRQLWQRLNDLAAGIHEIDPHHPVMTVVGTGRFEAKIREIARQGTAFDLLGINAYGDIAAVAKLARRFWPKPYVVAEWGPTGHWQVPRTQWGAPLEETSTQKARAVFNRYTSVIQADAQHCLGSFAFLWGQKQETTHTWYGMFQGDLSTESVDVMQYFWSGQWPSNRAPAVLALDIIGFADRTRVYLDPGQTYEARVVCYDCDYDALTFRWEIKTEVEIPKDSYAGSLEKPAGTVPGLIEEDAAARARFTAPEATGNYRLFVQILDGHGHVGYANAPFHVGRKTHPEKP
ncbi:MAG: hypothetical protein JW741_27495 [Sedimentisphaerales bacterium]|nr:hypothetical protein [Sedimentisphaerales bacterium]